MGDVRARKVLAGHERRWTVAYRWLLAMRVDSLNRQEDLINLATVSDWS